MKGAASLQNVGVSEKGFTARRLVGALYLVRDDIADAPAEPVDVLALVARNRVSVGSSAGSVMLICVKLVEPSRLSTLSTVMTMDRRKVDAAT